jgi:hypothetical protein
MFGGARTTVEESEKEATDSRRLRRQMQVGNEQDQGGDNRRNGACQQISARSISTSSTGTSL